MTAQTTRYQLTYPTADDDVAQAPAQFQKMCNSIESALATVDDRHTSQTAVPVVRRTWNELNYVTGIVGQSGYVTDDSDPSRNGLYVRSKYNGWKRADIDKPTEAHKYGTIHDWCGSLGDYYFNITPPIGFTGAPSQLFFSSRMNEISGADNNLLFWFKSEQKVGVRFYNLRSGNWTGKIQIKFDYHLVWQR